MAGTRIFIQGMIKTKFLVKTGVVILLGVLMLTSVYPHTVYALNEDEESYDFSQFEDLPPFRNIPWGASREYVLENDDSQRIETGENYLVLRNELGDLDMDITYYFWRDHFVKGVYVSNEELGSYESYIQNYRRLKDLLDQKYGEPLLDLRRWADHTYQNRSDRWLTALSNGHLEHFAFWEEEELIISIRLGSVDQRPTIELEYYIRDFEREMDQTDDSEILENL